MKAIIDTSTLISLTKIGKLDLLRQLKFSLIMPEEVYREAVVTGEEKGFSDATVIKRCINSHGIPVSSVKTGSIVAMRKKLNKVLSAGDEAVLSLAVQEKINMIITNDDGLGKIGVALGMQVYASPDILLKALTKNIADFREFEISIRSLVVENRLSSRIAELYIVEGANHAKG